MMKRVICLLLALVFCFALVACGTGGSKTGSDSKGGGTASTDVQTGGDPVEIVFGMFTSNEYADMDLVDRAVSDYTLEKYNFSVNTIPLIAPTYSDTVMLMMMGQEQLDLFHDGTLGAFDLVNWANQGMLADLTDLLASDGQGVTAALGDYINCGYVSGSLFFVPRVAEMAKAQGFTFNKKMVEDANIDINSIKSLEDMTGVLASLKEAYPTVAPLGVAASAETITRFFLQFDNLGNDVSGVLLNNGQDEKPTVVNLYESDIYVNTVKLVDQWNKAGYIIGDVNTIQDEAQAQLGAGRIACYTNDLKPGVDLQDTGRSGTEVVSVQLTPGLATTSSICNFGFSITSYSKYQKQAMQLMNLIYSDEYVHNLYCYGIEGTHYKWTDDSKTFVTFADGLDAGTSGYYPASNFLYGNISISYLWEGNSPTLYEETKQWAADGLISKGAGFSFDPTPVEAEFAAITSIYNEYAKALGNGTTNDVDVALKEYNDKLYAAGLEKVIAEKQKQLDAWLTLNGK